ncbi:MAG TPA: SAM-dependent methyltransferase, partial [Dehalococcoidia bacterium]|nr:SAM-dependent methyltransferase [Dehalococcoidia bacterium]
RTPASEFPSGTENRALKAAIISRIESENGISFRDFMEMALYHPQHGYYSSAREKMGRRGDYLTSPEVSPLFAVAVGRQLEEIWQIMGRPRCFEVVEFGAGSGALCRDVLEWAYAASPELAEALTYTIIEVSPALEQRQRWIMESSGWSEKARWLKGLEQASVEGCILSNEFLDSLPVHRVFCHGGELQEVYVGWDGSRFVEQLRKPSTPELQRYFQRLGLLPGNGCYTEVNLEAIAWMKQAASALRRGFVLTFDYGYEAPEMYAPWRKDGTLLCFYRHSAEANPYVRLGRQDITSHVDFTSLAEAGRESGLELLGIVTQADFLSRLGLWQAIERTEGQGLSMEEYFNRRRALLDLSDPQGLGRIRLMAQAKGVGRPGIAALEATAAGS